MTCDENPTSGHVCLQIRGQGNSEELRAILGGWCRDFSPCDRATLSTRACAPGVEQWRRIPFDFILHNRVPTIKPWRTIRHLKHVRPQPIQSGFAE